MYNAMWYDDALHKYYETEQGSSMESETSSLKTLLRFTIFTIKCNHLLPLKL